MMSKIGFRLLSHNLWSENLRWHKTLTGEQWNLEDRSPMEWNKRSNAPLSSNILFYGYKAYNHSIWASSIWDQGSTQNKRPSSMVYMLSESIKKGYVFTIKSLNKTNSYLLTSCPQFYQSMEMTWKKYTICPWLPSSSELLDNHVYSFSWLDPNTLPILKSKQREGKPHIILAGL